MKKTNALFGLILGAIFLTSNVQAEQKYMFGVHPFKNPQVLKTMFTPLTKYLSEELDTKVEFRSAKNYETAMELLVNGKVQFSYLGPSLYAILDEQYPGKIKIAAAVANKDGNPTFKGVIVVKEKSPIKLVNHKNN